MAWLVLQRQVAGEMACLARDHIELQPLRHHHCLHRFGKRLSELGHLHEDQTPFLFLSVTLPYKRLAVPSITETERCLMSAHVQTKHL